MNDIKKTLLGSAMALVLATGSVWAADSMGTSMGTKMDDAALTAKVKTALIDNPATKARQIDVETRDGVVQLNGFVDNASIKTVAEQTAMNISGVTSVNNNLQIRTGERTAGAAVDDATITGRVKAALIADNRTKARQIEVKTYKGIVTLGGFVTSSAEKQAAESVTGSVAGVVKVENGLQVK